jgi:hypothetical protein
MVIQIFVDLQAALKPSWISHQRGLDGFLYAKLFDSMANFDYEDNQLYKYKQFYGLTKYLVRYPQAANKVRMNNTKVMQSYFRRQLYTSTVIQMNETKRNLYVENAAWICLRSTSDFPSVEM